MQISLFLTDDKLIQISEEVLSTCRADTLGSYLTLVLEKEEASKQETQSLSTKEGNKGENVLPGIHRCKDLLILSNKSVRDPSHC